MVTSSMLACCEWRATKVQKLTRESISLLVTRRRFNKKTDEDGRLDLALIKARTIRTGMKQLPDEQAWRKFPPSSRPVLAIRVQLQP
jgi:hypothetical protein